ncbi:MAG: hypothetical protein ACI9SE_001369, partial [Neolewinella sp.]
STQIGYIHADLGIGVEPARLVTNGANCALHCMQLM